MTIEEVLQHDESFRYQLLGRLQMDCGRFLNGNCNSKDLWAHDPLKQIEYMKAIWDSFPKSKKPRWLNKKTLEAYERDLQPYLPDSTQDEIATMSPVNPKGRLFFEYNGKEIRPTQVYFGCQYLANRCIGGKAYAHYDCALRPVYIDTGKGIKRYRIPELRSVTADYKYGVISNFRRG